MFKVTDLAVNYGYVRAVNGISFHVERGETVLITRHGKPVARLVPDEDHRRADIRRAMAEIEEMRKSAPRVTAEEILAWRDEGRK